MPKVAHAAPAAGDVDIFVTSKGTYSVAEVENGMAGNPLPDEFDFAHITDYVSLTLGNYDIHAFAGGATAINVEDFTLSAGSISSLVARGPLEPSGVSTDFNVVVLSNN